MKPVGESCVGTHLSDRVVVKNGMKQGKDLLSFLVSFGLDRH